MIRMQVYIEEEQKQMLEKVSSKKNTPMAQLIREGIELVLEKDRNEDLQSAMEKSFGIWSDREDIADSVEYVRKLRNEWNKREERMELKNVYRTKRVFEANIIWYSKFTNFDAFAFMVS